MRLKSENLVNMIVTKELKLAFWFYFKKKILIKFEVQLASCVK